MNHYDFEMGVTAKPPRKPRPPCTTTTGRPTAAGGEVRRRTPSAGGDVSERYEAAIAAYGPGATWSESVTYWGTALYSREYDLSEMDDYAVDGSFVDEIADAIIADVNERGEGVRQDRVANIRHSVHTALRKQIARAREWRESGGAHYVPRAQKPQPPRFAAHVRNIIGGMDAEKGTVDWVRELSPCLDWIGRPPKAQTAAFVRAAFRPDELLFVRRAKQGTSAVPGVNIRPAADWVEMIERGERLPGECVTINPLTGRQGTTQDGKPSFRSHDCFADFPFALLEFDAMPLPMQYAFWRGFIFSSKLATALVSLTYSGGKSLHGLLNVGCRTLPEWQAIRKRLIDLFTADADERFRIDAEALAIDKAVRLPGVVRSDTGKVQELIYLNPEARSGTTLKGGVSC